METHQKNANENQQTKTTERNKCERKANQIQPTKTNKKQTIHNKNTEVIAFTPLPENDFF